ncbi:hypothetical protein BKH46_04810 [Helicobacter sp. 12S02634-8]|nr:hypothetical protein BKH46_04810 [Helicobacter sp. 12S02634-8]
MCEQIAQTLLSLKIPLQSRVALMGEYSFEVIATFFALCIKRCIITPLRPNYPHSAIPHLWADFLIQEGNIQNIQAQTQTPLEAKLQAQNASGLILFSSGSTGKPKGILHHLDTMLEFYAQKSPNPLNTAGVFLWDHIAGIDVLLSQLSIGGTLSIPIDRTPQALCALIAKQKVQVLPASPTFLRLLLLSGMHKMYDLSSLQLIIYGSEIMPPSLLQDLKNAFPSVRFKQSFGTSETNAIKTKNARSDPSFIRLDPTHTEYKIINNELWLKSKTQTLGYLGEEAQFMEGYFATGDLVEVLEENGEEYIKIIGRAKEIINVGGEKVLPTEIEEVVFGLEGIRDCLAYGESNPITGQSVALKVVLDPEILDPKDTLGIKRLVRKFCKDKLQSYKIPTKVIITDSLALSERYKKIRKS